MPTDDGKFQRVKFAIEQREFFTDLTTAFRLFNGFYEGYPGLVIDRYGETLVIFDHGKPGEADEIIQQIGRWAVEVLDGITSVLLKQRQGAERVKGILIEGNDVTQSIREFDVSYALNLRLNQDASFYLDTRNLRRWLLDHSEGLQVLNTFAYTGSLGVAAGMGNASMVIQTDLNESFLEIAQTSWDINHLDPNRSKVITADFFRVTGKMRREERLFDCVILDPPYFSTTEAGRVDLQRDISRLINKVRPLVAHQGWLILINNALFLSGEAFMKELKSLCKSPYLSFERIIPVPPDVTGTPNTILDTPPVNPAPFNHPTKIAILRVFRNDKQK
ncbi:MAG: class I SAM-dependent methyltransferase [Chloroflexota bacterium]|nr:class I SAM-dependent methyltransferase [Chloroflexota bacterium]